ncbi:MAG: hypothetical protein CMQ38_01300 [Gammaproteobacteria bacterium]|nr:hypothetical protein [Gammaproteobacteria bacterium]
MNSNSKQTGLQKYTLNTLSLFSEHFIRLTVGFLVSLWTIRYLGPDSFGMLSYAQAFAAILISFASLGLDAVVVRELLNEKNREGAVLGSVFVLKFGASLIAFLLIIGSALTIEGVSQQFYLIVLVGGPVLVSAFSTVEYYFQAKVQSHYIVQAKTIALITSSLVRIVLIQMEASLVAFAYAILFDSFVIATFLGIFSQRFGKKFFQWSIDLELVKRFFKSALFLSLNSAMVLIFWNVDKLMLRYLTGDFQQVGVYSAAVKLYELWGFIPVVLCASFFPSILSAKNNATLYKKRLQTLADVLFLVALGLTILGVFFSDLIINLALGAEFSSATGVFSIAMLGNVFVFLGVVGSRYFLAENLEYVLLLRTLIGLICNIIFNYFLIQQYGMIGAAVATVISSFIVAILADVIFYGQAKTIFHIKLNSVIGLIRWKSWLAA